MAEGTIGWTSVRSALSVLWRSLVVGAGYVLATMVGGAVAQFMGLPIPEPAARIPPAQAIVTTFMVGVVVGLIMGPLACRLTLSTLGRAGLLFGMIFVLNSLMNVLEALFFTATPVGEHLYGLTTSAIGIAGLAALLALLFRPASEKGGLLAALRESLGRRRWTSWVWRFLLAGALYVPIYFFFGMLVYPVVQRYYEDPALDLNLRVPGFEVILPLELARGLLIVLAVFPLIAVLQGSRWSQIGWLAATLAVLAGVTPMLQAVWFPLAMRAAHAFEIAADAAVHAVVIVLLVGTAMGNGKDRAPCRAS